MLYVLFAFRLFFPKPSIFLVYSTLLFSVSFLNSAHAYQYQHVGNPITQVFTIEDHRSGNQIWWINQYVDGRMLFATGNGLSTWDGENWQRSNTPNNTRIRDITIWHDDKIYAGAVGELGYFSPTDTGEFSFTVIPTDHLIDDFGQTRGVNSNSKIVVYSTEQAVLVWDGKQIVKINQFDGKGSRVFKIGEKLLIEDTEKMYSIELQNGEAVATPLDWQFPPNMRIKSVFLNQLNRVVMVTNMQGVFQLESDTFINVIAPNKIPVSHLNSGIQGQDGFYYLNSPIDGLMIFDQSFELMRHYKQNDGLGLSTIYNIYQDDQQNIWLAGLPNISVFQPPHLRSEYTSNTETLDFENIFNIEDNMFFSGTGFYQLTFPNGKTRSPIYTQIPDFNLVVLDILAVENKLMVATEAGVYEFAWTKVNDQIQISKPNLISTENWVSEITLSPNKQILYATIGSHLSQFEKINGQWQETQLVEDKSGFESLATQPIDDSQYNIWFTTEQQELYRLTSVDNKVEMETLAKFDNESTPLGRDHLRPVVYQQRMLIGTENGVIEHQQTGDPQFKLVEDLPAPLRTQNKDVFKIEVDNNQRIWYHAGHDTGVIFKDKSGAFVAQEAIFRPYNRSGTRGLAYFDSAIWFGVANGSTYRLSEESITHLPKAAPLSIQYVNSISRNTFLPINSAADAFSVDDNSIRIGFALSDYSTPTKTEYRTLLAGPSNQQWTQWSTENSKDFTLLAGGDYTLLVEAKDAWGRISAAQYSFAVAYPWYASYWARLIYFILLLVIIVISMRLGQKLRNKVLEQQNQNLEIGIQNRTIEIRNKVQELKQHQILKDKFFSNVSHEFRTPLTLTIGPLETILKECIGNLNVKTRDLTVTALNNARAMLALVGQVLDINRLEVGKLSLRVAKYDIAELLRANQQRFSPWAMQHQQEITLVNCENPHELYCDLDQIDKCVSNLLSNTIKYSGKGSAISIELIPQQQQLGIRIADNGHGIPSAHKNQVFERYYQEESSQNVSSTGTGIGLALVKELVNLHHGSIELVTEIDQGCQFTLWLPYGKSHFTEEQLLEPTIIQDIDFGEDPLFDAAVKNQTRILVVDDNAELRQFICQRLVSSYTVLEADNGQTGLDSAMKNLPDIIISDITMPVMTGLELTQKLKAHPDTKHIPVLLLSAQTMKRDIVNGFACGADDYLIKPFDTSELIMRLKTLVNSRKTFARQKIQTALSIESSVQNEDTFEGNMQKHIFASLHETDFNIEALSQLMFMSKETLRRKCNASYNMSPAAYIQAMRLQQAKLMLEKGHMNVSEVAFAIGFDSLAYFSKSFKQYHGQTPSAIMQQ